MSPTDNHAGSAAFAWLYRAALILIFAWLGYACLFGIANYWQWGHDGFNGAAFFNAARNAIKFHILGQAQYYFGDAPPPPDAIYTHHPLLLQLLLIKNFLVFGDHEWAGRLVPAFYSFATGALIYHSARLWYGHWHALFALAIYALTPLNLIFAHMINHEQLGIFWCLGTLHLFLSWFKTPTKLLMCAWLLAATLAVHSDWPGYYVCFYQALFLIAAYVATREQRGMRFVALLALSVVTLANLALFFTWIIQVKGGLNEMFGAYTLRTQALPLREYLKQQYTRSLELHGTWIHVLFAAWLANIIWRTLKRKLTLADALPLTFLFVQLLHSYLFKQAAFIHSYWLYYLSPAIAYGGADVIVRTTRQASERLHISAWAPITVFVLMVAAAWPFAYHQLLWGARSGTASFVSPYNDQHDLAMWFKHMTRVLKPHNATFVIHPNVGEVRIELAYYLARPHRVGSFADYQTYVATHPQERAIFLADLGRDESFTKQIGDISKQKALFRWDQRFIAVDSTPKHAGMMQWQSTQRHASWLDKWIINLDHAPMSWKPIHNQRNL